MIVTESRENKGENMKSRVYTGRNEDLIESLNEDMRCADTIKIIVSFIMESGVKLIAESLLTALNRGARVEILTGTYLGITEPSALYRLKNLLQDRGEIRIYNGKNSFHPKGYFIDGEMGRRVYVGSSNISRMGLIMGLEWNYIIDAQYDEESVDRFESSFDALFEKESSEMDMDFLRSYSAGWKKTAYIREAEFDENADAEEISRIEPRGIQSEALYELDLARKEGIERGLVAAATGSGKTYISAFDAKQFGASKVLFIAHREEILKQAMESFRNVHPDRSMALFNGQWKNPDADFIFASVQTLSRAEYLKSPYFLPDQFDYMIVDEFHHAAADSYRKVLDYFSPRFLLGLTATPYRMDNQDILALCENNMIYELSLPSAINRDVLCPYRYLGVYDLVDYSQVKSVNGKYALEDLEKAYRLHERSEEVYNKYKDYGGAHTIGFCASIGHAEEMASFFRSKGVLAEAVHSNMESHQSERALLVEKFREKKIHVLFAVDIFNEGVDIPEIDTVMFLRPTESYVVFLQQLGRGLRKHEGKGRLTVIDFIGNYKRAHYKPLLLAGKNPMLSEKRGVHPEDLDYPVGCQVTFDLRVIDLFKEMKKRDPLTERLRDEFYRLKAELGRRPTRTDLFTGSDMDHKEFMREGYLRYLSSIGELNEVEESWIGTEVEGFLRKVEKTSMSRSYKIPVLLALTENDGAVSYEELGDYFMRFYTSNPRRGLDLEMNRGNENWRTWSQKDYLKKALEMPVRFLTKKLLIHDREIKCLLFNDRIQESLSEDMISHMYDILEMLEERYFARSFLKR